MAQSQREKLHEILVGICGNAYFQPPSNIVMKYPCVVYDKSDEDTVYANNKRYKKTSVYNLTVMDRDPESTLTDTLIDTFDYCGYNTSYVSDNIHQTSLTLYY